MKIDCPHCGRKDNFPDDRKLPTLIRCPQCQNHFKPIPVGQPGSAETNAATASKTCDYCGEQILVIAKKCRYCGEILDVALRAAEEAKKIALSKNQSVIVNNNNNLNADAPLRPTVVFRTEKRPSLAKYYIRLSIVCFAMLFAGPIISLMGAELLGRAIMGLGLLAVLAATLALFVIVIGHFVAGLIRIFTD